MANIEAQEAIATPDQQPKETEEAIATQPSANTEIETEEAIATPDQQPKETEYVHVEQKEEEVQEIPQNPSVGMQQEMHQLTTTKKTIFDKDNNNSDNDSDDDDSEFNDEELFSESTHQFAVYYRKKQSLNGCIVAIVVIITQIILYLVCAGEVMNTLSGDDFLINVQVRFGERCNGSSAQFICPPDVPNLGYVALAAILLSLFLMHDIMASIRIFLTVHDRYAKITAIILLVEAIMAAFIGVFFAVAATSGYDAIANCIGVLFIHDIDEKAYEAFVIIESKRLKQKKKCCNDKWWPRFIKFSQTAIIFITAFAIMILALIIAGAIRGAQIANVIDEYGDDYYENQFSGGYYNFFDGSYYGWDQPQN